MDWLTLNDLLKKAENSKKDIHVNYTSDYDLNHSATGFGFLHPDHSDFIRIESDGESDVNIHIPNITEIRIVD